MRDLLLSLDLGMCFTCPEPRRKGVGMCEYMRLKWETSVSDRMRREAVPWDLCKSTQTNPTD